MKPFIDKLKSSRIFSLALVAILISFGVGYLGGLYSAQKGLNRYLKAVGPLRLAENDFPLVSPIIGIDSPSSITIGRFVDLQEEINEYVDSHKEDLTSFSLYFRELDTGAWMGINEDKEYAPASLFKLPLAIAIYKNLEKNPELANTTFTYTQEIDNLNKKDAFASVSVLKVGQAYKVSDLLDLMMEKSDNGAKNLLIYSIDSQILTNMFKVANVAEPAPNQYYKISPKVYSFFLRLLFNGSYLGAQISEKLLEQITKTDYPYALRAGVPTKTLVAHKFGSLNLMNPNTGEHEIGIHDCGIIYLPNDPYILCVMTRGQEDSKLNAHIAKVSEIVWNYMSQNDK